LCDKFAEEMSSIERTLRTLEHQLPDRAPVDLHNFMVTARMMGATSFAEFFRDGEAMAEGQIMAWRRFGHDVLLVENGTAALAEACGVQVPYQSDSAPVAKEPAIQSLDEVDNLELPDPYTHPLLRELLKATRIVAGEKGVRLAYHICGNATQIMGYMVSTGATIIEIDQKADMRVCKDAARGQATLLGPIDPSDVMANGTPELVTERCRETLKILAPGGGFILGPGCALPATTPDENIDALIDSAKRHGRYLAY
jgi:uroporphyrinogen-III decarboxylase